MKRYLAILGFWLIASSAFAGIDVEELPIRIVGTATTVSISTSSWTIVPASGNLSGRSGLKVSNPSSNTSSFVAVISTSSSAPGEATTVRPIEIEIGENPIIPIDEDLHLWLLSLNSSAENCHVQEVKQ